MANKPEFKVIVGDKLRKFLVSKKAFRKFVRNCKDPNSWFQKNTMQYTIIKQDISESRHDSICNAFLWRDTPEEHDYWERLSQQFSVLKDN